MMNCGVDIIEIERIKQAVEKNSGFLKKVFSKHELQYFENNGRRFETLAGFFAAKEAFVKYKKTGIRGIELSDVSVEHEESGAPFVVVKGEKSNVSLSISHNKTQAIAVVCGSETDSDLLRNPEIRELIPKRSEYAHKGDCGRVFIVAGSEGMTGAAVLSAKGALRSGAGLVTVGTAASQRSIVACGVVEAMTVALDEEKGKIDSLATEKILEYSKKSDVVVFGPGLGQNEHMHELLKAILSEYEGTLVIDADGLNALAQDCDILRDRRCSVVITPHPGEMSRLVKKGIDEIQKNRETVVAEFALEYGVTVVLKGKDTIVAEGNGQRRMYVNSTGNCGMATGGTGDVLSGVVAAFVAQGLDVFDAAKLGTYIHGKAGDIAAQKYGIHGLMAGDVAEAVAFALADELN